jgi:hypothetical protein
MTAGAYLAYLDATDGTDMMSPTPDPLIIDVSQAEFVLSLSTGWNFVTVPRMGWGYSADTLPGLMTGDLIAGWNYVTQKYDKLFIKGITPPSADFPIDPSTGYWIQVGGPRTLHLYGAVPTTSQIRQIDGLPVAGGWVGFACNSVSTTRLASEIASSYSATVVLVAWFNPATQKYMSYIVGVPPSDFVVPAGQAVWVQCTVDGTFTYDP